MDATAHIGPSIRIKGDVTAQEPLTIAGQVDGTIEVNGHALTVAPEARVNASITADTIVVGGTVTGSLLASTRILVRETATIDGDLSAPAIGLADGATVRGRLETTKRPAAVLSLAS
jgi:cytoskeletal protein CcmA (bactofilin family)